MPRRPRRPVYEPPEQNPEDVVYDLGAALLRGATAQAQKFIADLKQNNWQWPPATPPPVPPWNGSGPDPGPRPGPGPNPGPQQPPPPRQQQGYDPYQVLGVTRGLPLDVYDAAFKALARHAHPDRGGDPERMKALNRAIRAIREELRPK